jgi:hypothetical protein
MSGGSVPVKHYLIDEAIEYIQKIVDTNRDGSVANNGYKRFPDYSEEVIEKFRETVGILKRARIALNCVDYLVSEDDGEELFLDGWKKEMGQIIEYKKTNTAEKGLLKWSELIPILASGAKASRERWGSGQYLCIENGFLFLVVNGAKNAVSGVGPVLELSNYDDWMIIP